MSPGLSILVIGAAALLWLALRQGAARLPPDLRRGLGLFLLAAGLGLGVLRQFGPALGLAALGGALIAPKAFGGKSSPPSAGATSEVSTDAVRMTLDHDSGEMDGEILDGPFAGRWLSELSAREVEVFLAAIERDEDSLQLVFAWLDRYGRRPEPSPEAPATGPMSEADAYRVLGLEPGAGIDQVRAAHRSLIRKVHPDLGGSAALTALINAAKDRLDPG